MRIVHISETPAGGVGRHLIELCAGLRSRDCDVHLLYSQRRADGFFRQALENDRGLNAVRIDMHRSIHVHDLAACRRVHRYIVENGPFDVIHGHSSKGGAVARLAAPRGPTRLIYTPHTIYTMNPLLSRPSFQFYRGIELLLARRTDLIIANSPEEKEHILGLGVPAGKVHYVHYGIAPGEQRQCRSARAEFGLPADSLIVGFVGRLEPQKDPELLLRAMAQVMARHSAVVLAVVGTGSLEASLKRLASELGIEPRVFWLGYRPGEKLMAASDLLAVTSRYDAVSYTLIEGLALGLPIVSTDYAGVRVVVDPGVNGFVISSRDPAQFAAALEPLLSDADLRRRFGEASLEKAADFSADEMVARTLELYAAAGSNSKQRV
jgi:glycosyltransferase involved in cell wall biosynthesis